MNADNGQKSVNGKHGALMDVLVRIFVGVATAAILALGASHWRMSHDVVEVKSQLGHVRSVTDPEMKGQLANNTERIGKTESSISELRKAIEELIKSVTPQLAKISSDLEYVKNDLSRLSRLYDSPVPARRKE